MGKQVVGGSARACEASPVRADAAAQANDTADSGNSDWATAVHFGAHYHGTARGISDRATAVHFGAHGHGTGRGISDSATSVHFGAHGHGTARGISDWQPRCTSGRAVTAAATRDGC